MDKNPGNLINFIAKNKICYVYMKRKLSRLIFHLFPIEL